MYGQHKLFKEHLISLVDWSSLLAKKSISGILFFPYLIEVRWLWIKSSKGEEFAVMADFPVLFLERM